MIDNYDKTIYAVLHERLSDIEKKFDADALFYYGEFDHRLGIAKRFTDVIEQLKNDKQTKNRIVIFLNTPGGSVELVEKLVDIIRHHYNEVYFVIPDVAFSAGTIFCMSGDEIFMDYSSALGPIDPQVFSIKENGYVPALGYLDKVEELVAKSRDGTITSVEYEYFQGFDFAFLKSCEQARDLTVTLLKKWLVEYKIKDWDVYRTNPDNKGIPLTKKRKEQIAEEIAEDLGNHKKWLSHGRHIGIGTLQTELTIQIHDYSGEDEKELKQLIRNYNDFIVGFISRNGLESFIHSRHYI
ncbi:MAG: ATP-dependent Clp protease proteolytic subunit [Nitrospirae bacterium]|nr:ATP-dependent Clp protease proteolytic subunit [Nitrospirota bacterium]